MLHVQVQDHCENRWPHLNVEQQTGVLSTDGVVGHLRAGIQRRIWGLLSLGRFIIRLSFYYWLFILIFLVTARQLEERSPAVHICKLVESTKDQEHDHQTHKQVDCKGKNENACNQTIQIQFQVEVFQSCEEQNK